MKIETSMVHARTYVSVEVGFSIGQISLNNRFQKIARLSVAMERILTEPMSRQTIIEIKNGTFIPSVQNTMRPKENHLR